MRVLGCGLLRSWRRRTSCDSADLYRLGGSTPRKLQVAVRRTPRFFSSKLSGTERGVYGAATAWYVVATAAMGGPLWTPCARVRPLVFGMPFALFWLALILAVSFGVAVALYRWESRRGVLDERVLDDKQGGEDHGAARGEG